MVWNQAGISRLSGLQAQKAKGTEEGKSLKDICGRERCWKQKLKIYLPSLWILKKKINVASFFFSFVFRKWLFIENFLRKENYLQNISTFLSLSLSFTLVSILSFEYKFQFFSLLIFVLHILMWVLGREGDGGKKRVGNGCLLTS